jgi:ADP-dependent NAD(P)H-hydrate dehydratase / NAD(P)H-hydrate epimerase
VLVLRAQDVAALDDAAARAGHPPDVLMARAGRAVAAFTVRAAPAARRVAVLVGPGNNGGDGYVAAADLVRRGREVLVVELVAQPASDAARVARRALDELPEGARARLTRRTGPLEAAHLHGVDVVVDALLGAGRNRPVGGALAAWFDVVRASGLPVVAVDVPSGLDADRAALDGPVLAATWTLQLSAAKPASFLAPARTAYGVWSVDDLGLPTALVADHATARAWRSAAAGTALPRRAADVHKFRAGTVLVVAGSPRYPGAAILAARGALRAGAGYVACTGPDSDHEIVRVAWDASPKGARALRDGDAGRRAHALLIGPGLEVDDATLAALLDGPPVPTVLDGGALRPALEARVRAHGAVLLTPHAGEAGRWLGRPAADVAADPLAAAADLADRSGAVVVLKGPGTVIAAPGGPLHLVPGGPPALATAGSGDVLAGVLAALLAAAAAGAGAAGGPDAAEGRPWDARTSATLAAAGVALHAEAARQALAAWASGGTAPSAGLTAADVAASLPAARAVLEATAVGDGC